MAIVFIKIDPDRQVIRHTDWETWGLAFQCLVHNGIKYARVEEIVGNNGAAWFSYVNAISGVTATVLTEGQVQTIKDTREFNGLESSIEQLRIELDTQEARYVALGGDLGDIPYP